MSTRLPGDNPTAYLGIKETNPPQLYFRNRAPTAADSRPYDQGDLWIDQVALEAWILARNIGGVADWVATAGTGPAETITGNVGGAVGPDGADNINFLGGGGLTVTGNPGTFTLTVAPSGGGSLVETFTGDAGGAVGPDGVGNIDILGNSGAYLNGIQFTGAPGANTLTAIDLRNITVYVVDAVAGQTEYQTVQAGIDAANAAGGGTVYVRPGTYTEDLALYDAVDVTAAVATPAGYQTTIIGSHTPPAAGAMSFRNLALSDTTDILASAVAGTTTIVIIDCITDVANGYTINLPNWTGLIAFLNSHCVGTQDGFADIGTGGADLLALNSTLGVGTTNVGAVGGTSRIVGCNIQCDLDTVLTGVTNMRACQWIYTLLFSDDSTGIIDSSICIQDVDIAINHTSTVTVSLSDVTFDSSGNPDVIDGTGTVLMGSVTWLNNDAINAGITISYLTAHETGVGYMDNISFDRGTSQMVADGELIIGSAGVSPVINTLTAGAGIGIAAGAGTITISATGSGMAWVDATNATYNMAIATAYGCNRGGGVAFTLPAVAAQGTIMEIVGILGLWNIVQGGGQSIEIGMFTTTVGAGGSLTATNVGDCVSLRCITANTVFRVENMMGNPAIV